MLGRTFLIACTFAAALGGGHPCLARLPKDTYRRQPGVDAQHYAFALTLRDGTDAIDGEALVRLRFTREGVASFFLDLASPADGKGMKVAGVLEDGVARPFTHGDDRLEITLPAAPRAGETRSFVVRYGGVPAGGLHVGRNRYKERCTFSWNWPDQARQWLPLIDHPSDKATSEFIVTAPVAYGVVANGLREEETFLGDGSKRTRWKQSVPIASWLNAIGVAPFAVHYAGPVKGVELQTWVPRQDLEKGIAAFEGPARKALEFFTEHVGPYPYEKLANVSAAFGGGGTEHASAVFYAENLLDGNAEDVVVHEIAHQWFGCSVTERDWDDIWLSEGFATYFTLLYQEHVDGRDAFVRGLERSRTSALAAEKRLRQPLVHRNISDLRNVNPGLVYQKGAWILHMLRIRLGTEVFWKGMRDYYRRFRDANADSEDFRRVMEEASGQDLRGFFAQWLHRVHSPALQGSWSYDAAAKKVRIELEQTQPGDPYRFTLDVALLGRMERIEIGEAKQRFEIAAEIPPKDVTLDPVGATLMDPPRFQGR